MQEYIIFHVANSNPIKVLVDDDYYTNDDYVTKYRGVMGEEDEIITVSTPTGLFSIKANRVFAMESGEE